MGHWPVSDLSCLPYSVIPYTVLSQLCHIQDTTTPWTFTFSSSSTLLSCQGLYLLPFALGFSPGWSLRPVTSRHPVQLLTRPWLSAMATHCLSMQTSPLYIPAVRVLLARIWQTFTRESSRTWGMVSGYGRLFPFSSSPPSYLPLCPHPFCKQNVSLKI